MNNNDRFRIRKLINNIINAFPSLTDIQFLADELEAEKDGEIRGRNHLRGASLVEITDSLVDRAEANGWLIDLIDISLRKKPENAGLQESAREFGIPAAHHTAHEKKIAQELFRQQARIASGGETNSRQPVRRRLNWGFLSYHDTDTQIQQIRQKVIDDRNNNQKITAFSLQVAVADIKLLTDFLIKHITDDLNQVNLSYRYEVCRVDLYVDNQNMVTSDKIFTHIQEGFRTSRYKGGGRNKNVFKVLVNVDLPSGYLETSYYEQAKTYWDNLQAEDHVIILYITSMKNILCFSECNQIPALQIVQHVEELAGLIELQLRRAGVSNDDIADTISYLITHNGSVNGTYLQLDRIRLNF